MKKKSEQLCCVIIGILMLFSCQGKQDGRITVPFILDHNRMMVDAEFLQSDGSWRKTRLWVDTGNPDFFMSPELAHDLGIDLSELNDNPGRMRMEIAPPESVRIGGMPVSFEGVRSAAVLRTSMSFSAAHNDANLPSTVLKNYQVVLDYPKRQLILAEPGKLRPEGDRVTAGIHPTTGIPQIDAVISGRNYSLALDNGASYSFVSDSIVQRLAAENPELSQMTGVVGCANMWGWWPENENTLTVLRIPEIKLGDVSLKGVGLVGVPLLSPNGPSLGGWYSRKTAKPVIGFLGPNAFKAYRVEIDYAQSSVYFKKGREFDVHDMDLVGISLRPEADGNYRLTGVAHKNGKPVVSGVQQGDLLLRVDDLIVKGNTMGTVVDALRGKPGQVHTLTLERDGAQFTISASVERFLEQASP